MRDYKKPVLKKEDLLMESVLAATSSGAGVCPQGRAYFSYEECHAKCASARLVADESGENWSPVCLDGVQGL